MENLVKDKVLDNGRLKVGNIVQHFKRELLTPEEQKSPKYLYVIVAIAYHTETEQPLVIYKALYGERKTYARPYDMFISEVDHTKYPQVKQLYRFERLSDWTPVNYIKGV